MYRIKPIAKFYIRNGVQLEDRLYRVRKEWILRFVLDETLQGSPVRFFTNYVLSEDATFDRWKFCELPMKRQTGLYQHFELENLHVSGSFQFFFTIDGTDCNMAGGGYFIVDPRFNDSKSLNLTTRKYWSLDGIVLQTYLAKNLGPFSEWPSRLEAAIKLNYNMIHFTPLQALGYSRSAYSLKDQLSVNPEFGDKVNWDDIEKYVKSLEQDHGILCMTDLVFNHTSNDSPWLHEHPECGYNIVNSPHLAGAYILDRIIRMLTLQAAKGDLVSRGIPARFGDRDSMLAAIRAYLFEQINKARIYEYYTADVDLTVTEFKQWLKDGQLAREQFSCGNCLPSGKYCNDHEIDDVILKELWLRVGGPRAGLRFGGMVDFRLAARHCLRLIHQDRLDDARIHSAGERLRAMLNRLNFEKIQEVQGHMEAAVNNVLANIAYRFCDPGGPCLQEVTANSPFMWHYFYHPLGDDEINSLDQLESLLEEREGRARLAMAFNGWVMTDNPLRNFAEDSCCVYLRRELIVWGDSVKLRYGRTVEVCPYLWQRMSQYVELTARIFHAVRLDNCHSTPLHVAEYLLDRARAVRPNIYIVAELFTGSERLDNIFINKLGINSLIRESLQAGDVAAFSSLLHRYGAGQPAGSFANPPEFVLKPTVAHALLYDQTHDNESPAVKRSLRDYLPLAALVSMVSCASGSTRGYDELVPHHINVVTEERRYVPFNEREFMLARRVLNRLHQRMSLENYVQTYVSHKSANIIAVTRFCPDTGASIMAIAHCAFWDRGLAPSGYEETAYIEVNGNITGVLLEARTVVDDKLREKYSNEWEVKQKAFHRDPKLINGLAGLVAVQFNVEPTDSATSPSDMFDLIKADFHQKGVNDVIKLRDFPPGSVLVVRVELNQVQKQAFSRIMSNIKLQFENQLRSTSSGQAIISVGAVRRQSVTEEQAPSPDDEEADDMEARQLNRLAARLSPVQLNKALFRCGSEAQTDPQDGLYDVPGHGQLVYAGFQGVMSLLEQVRLEGDLGHALCENLRKGPWLPDFLCNRLVNFGDDALGKFGQACLRVYQALHQIADHLRPTLFDLITSGIHDLLSRCILAQMPTWIQYAHDGSVQRLALASMQFYGEIRNAQLPPLVDPSQLATQLGLELAQVQSLERCSLAAGLPHFAEGMWRSWGRDTFVAFRGLLLLTGRLQEAAILLLQYASLIRHGLVPNLCGDGETVESRYNCRDAVWFWLHSLMQYEAQVMEREQTKGVQQEDLPRSIMQCSVGLCFASDEATSGFWPTAKAGKGKDLSQRLRKPLWAVVMDVLQRHWVGIDFVEHRAGRDIDEYMRPEGFHITARIDPETGFPTGGNRFNCGTWMDKMGSSDSAGNRGLPATPRDGAPVECVGLCYAVVQFLAKHHSRLFPSSTAGVQDASGHLVITWQDWAAKIKQNFEKHFWMPNEASNNEAWAYNRGGYRDTVGSSLGYTDHQLRPNFLVAMTAAPDLFTKERARGALKLVQEHLLGPVGVLTLGRNDLAYRGDYQNSYDGPDFHTARGYNYHQGPEWLWPLGHYIRARIQTHQPDQEPVPELVEELEKIFARLDLCLRSSPWKSLPELTNSNGSFCEASCPAQAWSVGCALEAAFDYARLRALL